MPEPTKEPDKYTIDDMMDRLKNRGSSDGEGELVTRRDGSQAVRMKKRKRRTDQAVNKETKRNQRVQFIQIAGFVVIVVLLFFVAGIAILYANSTGFREGLAAKAKSASGAETAFTQFRMNPANANANSLRMEWPAGNVFSTLEVSSVVAKIAPRSFLGKVFAGEEIVAAKGDLVLQVPVAEEKVRYGSPDGEVLPVNFNRYSVPGLDIHFGKQGSSTGMLEKTEASFFPSAVSGHGEIRLNGGLLKVADWPVMGLDRSYAKMRGAELHVESMRFHIPETADQRVRDKGSLDFSGTLRPLEPAAVHTLSAKVESFRLSYLLGEDLGRFFLGRVDTRETPESNFLKFTPGDGKAGMLELTLDRSLDSRIDVSGFVFLRSLSRALQERWYELPTFESEGGLVLRREGGGVGIQEINLEQRGRMALRGSIENGEGGSVSGEIRVGIPDTTLLASGNERLMSMFGPVREGYRWIDVKIGGTSAVPSDDFLDKYDQAVVTEGGVPDDSGAGGTDVPDSFEDLIEGD